MNATTAHVLSDAAAKQWLVRPLKNLAMGTLLGLTPVTAVVVLGWIGRDTRRAALTTLGSGTVPVPLWIAGSNAGSRFARWTSGLMANAAEGLRLFLALGLATLPFTALLIGSWWGGWENSFNKGYEQALAGPLTALAGVVLGLWILAHLPLALVHAAVEERAMALFEIGRVRKLAAHARWRLPVLAFATVIAALPLFAAKVTPVFLDPAELAISKNDPAAAENIMFLVLVAASAWVFMALTILRRMAARIYARSVQSVFDSPEAGYIDGTRAAALVQSQPMRPRTAKAPSRIGRFLNLMLTMLVLLGLLAQIYLAQFLNHSWISWLNHPFFLLPWAG